jgi:hypothetical protein
MQNKSGRVTSTQEGQREENEGELKRRMLYETNGGAEKEIGDVRMKGRTGSHELEEAFERRCFEQKAQARGNAWCGMHSAEPGRE